MKWEIIKNKHWYRRNVLNPKFNLHICMQKKKRKKWKLDEMDNFLWIFNLPKFTPV